MLLTNAKLNHKSDKVEPSRFTDEGYLKHKPYPVDIIHTLSLGSPNISKLINLEVKENNTIHVRPCLLLGFKIMYPQVRRYVGIVKF
jgi:hypothetical protein